MKKLLRYFTCNFSFEKAEQRMKQVEDGIEMYGAVIDIIKMKSEERVKIKNNI